MFTQLLASPKKRGGVRQRLLRTARRLTENKNTSDTFEDATLLGHAPGSYEEALNLLFRSLELITREDCRYRKSKRNELTICQVSGFSSSTTWRTRKGIMFCTQTNPSRRNNQKRQVRGFYCE